MKKKLLTIVMLCASLFSACAKQSAEPAETAEPAKTEEPAENGTKQENEFPRIETDIYEFKKHGNIVLSVKPAELKEAGYEIADVIHVEIGASEIDMPITEAYTEVASGKPVCVFKTDGNGNESTVLAINAGNIVDSMKIGQIIEIEEDPGYDLIFNDGYSSDTPVYITMSEKQGYAQEFAMFRLAAARTNSREDYAELSDEQYANFRFAKAAGLGKNILARSSSPVDPALNRNKEADQAIADHGIRTVMNMADNAEIMTNYEGYADTHYSSLDVIPLNMQMDFGSDIFKEKFGEGMRFLISHEGPYLIHCKEGKDRTGFALALLELLMGASREEVIGDYMVTYFNFYGIKPSDAQYQMIADYNLKASLVNAFGIESFDDENTDLCVCAEKYLHECGLSDDEIVKLKERLSKDSDSQ